MLEQALVLGDRLEEAVPEGEAGVGSEATGAFAPAVVPGYQTRALYERPEAETVRSV